MSAQNKDSPSFIFWPLDLYGEGYCYGWTEPCVCIAGLLPSASFQDADARLQAQLNISDSYLAISGLKKPCIIGHAKRWLDYPRLEMQPTLGTLSKLYMGIFVFYFRHPRKGLRFYSFDVLPFRPSDPPHGRQYQLHMNLTAQSTFKGLMSSQTNGFSPVVVEHFNASRSIEELVQTSRLEQKKYRMRDYWRPILDSLMLSITPIMVVLEWIAIAPSRITIPAFLSASLVPSSVQQIHLRASQSVFLSRRYPEIFECGSVSLPDYAIKYVNFYNLIWLILNDMIFGHALGAFLSENNEVLTSIMTEVIETLLIKNILNSLAWLNHWPAGLKLNTELSQFYASSFHALVSMSGTYIRVTIPYLPVIINLCGAASWGGATLGITMISDALSALTIHITLCYWLSSVVYAGFLRILGSLWNLFRGKRYNALRNRVDSWDYDVDQLLVGTMLFTLVAFLFPTILIYYVLFALLRLVILLLHASLDLLLSLMNHFPLFMVMLRFKDPWRWPGGIYISREPISPHGPISLVVKSHPVPFSAIFAQYARLWSQLAGYYNPLRLVGMILAGRYVSPIPRSIIQYELEAS